MNWSVTPHCSSWSAMSVKVIASIVAARCLNELKEALSNVSLYALAPLVVGVSALSPSEIQAIMLAGSTGLPASFNVAMEEKTQSTPFA